MWVLKVNQPSAVSMKCYFQNNKNNNNNNKQTNKQTNVWIFPETGVYLANLITEAEKVESAAQESSEYIWYSK